MTKKKIFIRIGYAFLTLLLCVIFVICGQSNLSAFADTMDGVRAAYENINVWDNLQGAVIGGNEFNIEDYPHKERDEPRIIQFVELCYSFYSDKQSDYGLYIYVYNPQDLVFDTATSRNTINMKCGNLSTEVYSLEFVNYCNKAGYEGRFYEFKVGLTNSQTYNILHSLKDDSREYEIVSFTLSVKGELKTYTYAQKWTYSGFVKGYGSELAESDTLTCTVDGFRKYVELEVEQTVYRPKGDYYEGKQAQLNSCYFVVPEKFFTDYGKLNDIRSRWYEYVTQPVLVTENALMSQLLNKLHGDSVDNFDERYSFLIDGWSNTDTAWFKSSSNLLYWFSNIHNYESSYYFPMSDGVSDLISKGRDKGVNRFDNFAAVFYTGANKSYKDVSISSEMLTNALLKNSEHLGGSYVNDRFSEALFSEFVNPTHTRGLNDKIISLDNIDDYPEVFWNVTTKSTVWQEIFGGYDVDTYSEKLLPIYEVKAEDLEGSDADISARLYVGESEVKDIKNKFNKAGNDGRLVLFRYGCSDYYSVPITEILYSVSKYSTDKMDNELVKASLQKHFDSWLDGQSAPEHTGYVAQETVYLDFQIISLWFKAEDGTKTEVPVVMTPQDVISGLQPPLDEDYHDDDLKNLLSIILGVLGVVLIVVLLGFIYPFVSPIINAFVKGVWWLITLPFRLIGKLFKRKKE